MPLLDTETSVKIASLQMLDDAIAFRLHRLSLPCQDCTGEQKCADHACDVDLIEGYQDTYAQAFSEMLAQMDPADIARIMQPGDATPPTVSVLAAAVLTRLRELAADGPVMTQLDSRPVMIELDGHDVVEHPLVTGSDGPDGK